ncbi:MAG: hypothetical protein ACRDD1_17880, partial [Planctomycetia bacterium]
MLAHGTPLDVVNNAEVRRVYLGENFTLAPLDVELAHMAEGRPGKPPDHPPATHGLEVAPAAPKAVPPPVAPKQSHDLPPSLRPATFLAEAPAEIAPESVAAEQRTAQVEP